MGLIFCLHLDIQFSKYQFWKTLSFCQCIFWHLCKILGYCHYVYSYLVYLDFLFYFFILFLHIYFVPMSCFLFTISLQYTFKYGVVILLALFFLLRIALSIQDLLQFYSNFRISFSYLCQERHGSFYWDCTGQLYCSWQDDHFHININSTNS